MNLLSSKTVLAALGAAVLSLATTASAQTSNVHVDVPFSFVAGDQHLSAGQYRFDIDDARHLFRITSVADGSVSYVRVLPVTTRRGMNDTARPTVRFAKEGDQYVLQGVWRQGAVEGNTVLRSRRNTDSAKTLPVRDITSGSN